MNLFTTQFVFFNMKILSLLILLTFTLGLRAQSFWKSVGVETHENALHSGISYSSSHGTIFVSTYNMGIFRSTNKGATWDHILALPKDQTVTTLFTSKNGTLFGGGAGKIFRSETNGEKWDEIPIDFIRIRRFVEDHNGYLFVCSADSGGILRSEDNGISWTKSTNGLPTNYVNNIAGDGNGNLFCTLLTDENDKHGGLFFWNEQQNQWLRKEIKLNLNDTEYVIKVSQILDIDFTPSSEIIISLDGVASNFFVGGLFRNSVSGAIANNYWQQENWNDTIPSPFGLIMNGIFPTSTGHVFANRISSTSAGVYAKMAYTQQWISRNENIPETRNVKGFFCETPEGTVYLTTEFSNKLLVTNESEPGKKYFKISYGQLKPMKLYEYQNIHAASASGQVVNYISMDNKTNIEGNVIRAIGLGNALIKAYTEGNDSMYFSSEIISLSIAKAENNIIMEDPGVIVEGDTSNYLNASATSGEEVIFEVIDGHAYFERNRLIYGSPGEITFIATEPGNDTYEQADTVWMKICIYPKKPIIIADTVSGTVKLISSNEINNRWYVNDIFSGYTDNTIYPEITGIYTLQVFSDVCFSEFSEPYQHLATGIDPVSDLELLVFPNPFHDKLSIQMTPKKNSQKDIQYNIMDITGKVLLIGKCERHLTILDLKGFEPGWYVLNLTQKQYSEFFKILKYY
ncbi:MAG: T9SS type A sorting domain-containing protein [Bacteroidales bacterium]|nr:T9SS type A sorting domain-containing protein [Bacteroidales bacterium]